MRARSIGLATAWMLAASLTTGAQKPIDLSANATPALTPTRVEIDLRVAGEVTAEKGDPLRPEAARSIAVQVGLAYTQEPLTPGAESVARVARLVEGGAGPMRMVVAHEDLSGACIVSADGVLSRPQLDRLQLPADPLDVDSLLPGGEVLPSDSWKVDPVSVERVLRVASVSLSEVIGVIETSTAKHAKLRFAGPVHGRAEGARVEIDLRGVALFDRRARRITQLNLAWQEERTLGPATPALRATAKLNIKIQPANADQRLGEIDRLIAETAPLDRRLAISAADGGWRLLADRDWYVVASDRHATTLRRVTGDAVSMLTTIAPSTAPRMTLASLEQEVRYALGGDLAQVLSTEQTPHSGGATIAIASAGRVDDRPVEWRHHHVSTGDAAIAVTTTLPTVTGPADDAPLRRLLASLEPTSPTASAASRADAVRR